MATATDGPLPGLRYAMTPSWARPRTPEQQREMERAEIMADIQEWRAVDPRELGRRMATMIAAATRSAQQSPFWAQASLPEPMAPEAAARWRRLVAEHRARHARG